MASNFGISVDKISNGFGLKLAGDFDATSAYELIYAMGRPTTGISTVKRRNRSHQHSTIAGRPALLTKEIDHGQKKDNG
ncbi:MAG: hypothetical protein H6R26_3022 [Proteobacteria bacterium]|jgi:hypothetical protein|nr:hypothetical protein [Pseudomonadota bacterium]